MPGTLSLLSVTRGGYVVFCLFNCERIKNLRPICLSRYWNEAETEIHTQICGLQQNFWQDTPFHILPSPFKEIKSPFLTWKGPPGFVWLGWSLNSASCPARLGETSWTRYVCRTPEVLSHRKRDTMQSRKPRNSLLDTNYDNNSFISEWHFKHSGAIYK